MVAVHFFMSYFDSARILQFGMIKLFKGTTIKLTNKQDCAAVQNCGNERLNLAQLHIALMLIYVGIFYQHNLQTLIFGKSLFFSM